MRPGGFRTLVAAGGISLAASTLAAQAQSPTDVLARIAERTARQGPDATSQAAVLQSRLDRNDRYLKVLLSRHAGLRSAGSKDTEHRRRQFSLSAMRIVRTTARLHADRLRMWQTRRLIDLPSAPVSKQKQLIHATVIDYQAKRAALMAEMESLFARYDPDVSDPVLRRRFERLRAGYQDEIPAAPQW